MFDTIGLISKKFSEMPIAVQIFTYVVLVLLYVYLILVPRFVNGQLITKDSNGGILPYRGVPLQMSIEGRVFKFKSNESGHWSIPLISMLPRDVRIQFYHEDAAVWREVVLSSVDAWTTDEFRVEVIDADPWVKIEQVSNSKSGLSLAFEALLGETAHAGRLVLPEELDDEDVAEASTREEYENTVYDIAVNEIASLNNVSADTPFSGKDGLKYIDRIRVIERLESELNVYVPDEHWRSFSNFGQLSEYMYSRKKLQFYTPESSNSKQRVSWPEISQSIGPEKPIRFEY